MRIKTLRKGESTFWKSLTDAWRIEKHQDQCAVPCQRIPVYVPVVLLKKILNIPITSQLHMPGEYYCK